MTGPWRSCSASSAAQIKGEGGISPEVQTCPMHNMLSLRATATASSSDFHVAPACGSCSRHLKRRQHALQGWLQRTPQVGGVFACSPVCLMESVHITTRLGVRLGCGQRYSNLFPAGCMHNEAPQPETVIMELQRPRSPGFSCSCLRQTPGRSWMPMPRKIDVSGCAGRDGAMSVLVLLVVSGQKSWLSELAHTCLGPGKVRLSLHMTAAML